MSVCSSSRRRAAVRRWLRQAEARDNRREHRPAPCPSTGCEHLGLATARHVYQQSNLLALSSTDALNVDHSPLRPSSLVLLLLPPPLALSSASWAPRPRVPVFDSGSVNPLPHLYPRRSAAHPASASQRLVSSVLSGVHALLRRRLSLEHAPPTKWRCEAGATPSPLTGRRAPRRDWRRRREGGGGCSGSCCTSAGRLSYM